MEVIIVRPKQFADMARSYELNIDGKFIRKIGSGEEVRITIPDNAKVLTASIDWCTSNEFDLSSVKENDRIEVKNSMSKKVWIPFYVFYAITVKKRAYISISKAS